MNKRKMALVSVGILLFIFIAWYLISPLFSVIEVNEVSPTSENVLFQGNFVPSAHDVLGKVLVIEGEKKILRFEDFETVNGPDLHIYLATSIDVEDYIDLGAIKATKGNVNYEIPEGVDLSKYNTVVVWCVPFKVLFSYAELK